VSKRLIFILSSNEVSHERTVLALQNTSTANENNFLLKPQNGFNNCEI